MPEMPDRAHTYLVECFAPGIDDAAVAAAADRVRAVLADRPGSADPAAYLGALLMAEDEVVFHAFRAGDALLVREISEAAGLEFERVVESVGLPAEHGLDTELTEDLIRAGAASAIDLMGREAARRVVG
jgi:hypothetical protein